MISQPKRTASKFNRPTLCLQILRTRVRRSAAGIFAADGVRWTARACDQPHLVEWAIRAAPPTVDIYNRLGDLVFRLGDDRARFGVGVTNLYYQDPATDLVTPFARQHMALSVRLVGALPQFDLVSTIGIIQDIPQTIADLYAALEMTAHRPWSCSSLTDLFFPIGRAFACATIWPKSLCFPISTRSHP
jgi:hypothetical protein